MAFDKGVPLVNALVLGDLCEYQLKSYIAKSRFFGLHFVQTAEVSSNWLQNLPTSVENRKIMAITPFKVYKSKAHRRLLLVFNTNLRSYLAQFPSYCRLLVKFSLQVNS